MKSCSHVGALSVLYMNIYGNPSLADGECSQRFKSLQLATRNLSGAVRAPNDQFTTCMHKVSLMQTLVIFVATFINDIFKKDSAPNLAYINHLLYGLSGSYE